MWSRCGCASRNTHWAAAIKVNPEEKVNSLIIISSPRGVIRSISMIQYSKFRTDNLITDAYQLHSPSLDCLYPSSWHLVLPYPDIDLTVERVYSRLLNVSVIRDGTQRRLRYFLALLSCTRETKIEYKTTRYNYRL